MNYDEPDPMHHQDPNGSSCTDRDLPDPSGGTAWQISLAMTVSGISSSLIRIGPTRVGSVLESVLEELGMASNADEIRLFQLSADRSGMAEICSWSHGGHDTDAAIPSFETADVPLLIKKLEKLEMVGNIDPSSLPEPELSGELEKLGMRSSDSIAVFPLILEGELAGFMTFRTAGAAAVWNRITRYSLELASSAVSSALYRMKVAESIRESQLKVDERKKFLEALLESIPDAIVTLNSGHRIIDWNPGAEELFGYTREEVEGKDIDDLISGPGVESETRSYTKRILKGGNLVPTETVRYRKDRSPVDVLLAGSPVIIDGELKAVLAIYTDITEKKRAQAEHFRQSRMESMGTLASGIAHDFNNMLSVIFGNISLAKSCLSENSIAYGHIETIDRAMERATGLTQQLLTFAKGGEPVIDSVSPGPFLREAVEFNLAGSSIKYHLSLARRLWNMQADSRQITQVISNLVINSMQAMPDGGDLFVSADNYSHSGKEVRGLLEGDFVRISIRDHGAGIPKEDIERIFDPYFSTKKEGSGLGLAVVHSIVKKHGGAIKVESRPGDGTCFTIFLPAAGNSEGDTEPEGSTFSSPRKPGGIEVLIMDDESMIRSVLDAMLRRLDCRVDQSSSGDQAIEMYRRRLEEGDPYQLVIMDLTVPGGMGGREAARVILKLHSDAYVVVSSGYSTDPVMSEHTAYGFSDVLAKPYRIEDLQEVLDRRISRLEANL